MESKWVCEGSGPPGGIGEDTARKYVRDIVSGLMYLHAHVRPKPTFVHDFIYSSFITIRGVCFLCFVSN